MPIFLLLGLALLHPKQGPAQTLRTLAQEGASVKYASGDPFRRGICWEIAEAVDQLDTGLSFHGIENTTPLMRIEKQLETNQIDVFFCMLKTREREARFHFIDHPLYSIRHVLLVKADDNIQVSGYEDLIRLGDQGIVLVHHGSALVRVLDEMGVKYIYSAKNDSQLIQMLNSGRGRFIYGQDLSLMEMLRRMKLDGKYRILSVVLKEESQYLAYSRRLDPALVLRLEKALRTLTQTGRLEQIVSRYRY